jgi:uroporphyrinogen decarboxylase
MGSFMDIIKKVRNMTRKERIKKIIHGDLPDYTPHHFDLTMRMTDRLGEHYGFDREGLEDYIGNHLLYVDFTGPDNNDIGFRGSAGGNGKYFDEFGVEWNILKNYNIGDWGMAGRPVKNMDFKGYVFPDGCGKGRFKNAMSVIAKYPDRFNVLRISGPFDLGWHLTGFEDFIIAMAANDDIIFKVMDRTTEYMVNIIEAIPEEIDAVRILEDWGIQKGLLFSKNVWMKYIYPYYKQLHAAISKKGLYKMHHSCGDITELFPELIKLGVDIVDAIQPEAMDTGFLKKEYGKDIVLFGGLGSQSTIPLGTPEQVICEAKKTLALLGAGGKYIIGPAGSVPTEAPLENVIALVEFCMNLRYADINLNKK